MAHRVRSLLAVAILPVILSVRCSLGGTSGGTFGGTLGGAACSTIAGPQGWTDCQIFAWYTTSQGSRMMPQAWLHALEQPDGTAPFLDAAYFANFRYLPSPVTAADVDPKSACPLDPALPLGFVVDCQPDSLLQATKLRWRSGQSDHEPWVGLNCSACHTAEMTYNGTHIRIEGGPTLADFQSMTESLDRSLAATLIEPKFGRFARAVLGPNATSDDTAMLRQAMTTRVQWNTALARLNGDPRLDGNPMQYGFGRLDAIGHIFNKVALIAMPDDAIDQIANPSDAPVSYPFLWNVPQQDKVEWNGLASNNPPGSIPGITFDVGALGRNTGEVTGVFADVIVTRNPGKLTGYTSSIHEPVLEGMEVQIGSLSPPKWPAAFPPIDQALAQQGAQVFRAWHCDSCHTVPTIPASLTERYTVTLSHVFAQSPGDLNVVGTDMWMACNTALDMAKPGLFLGTPAAYVTGAPLADPSFNAALVKNAVAGSLIGKKSDVIATDLEGIFGMDRGLPLPSFLQAVPGQTAKDIRRQKCMSFRDDPKNPQMVYKGRPLQGIWATPPYLHNGSVPTLYDLLLPPDQRPTRFSTGTREFDPVRVGYRTEPSAENSFVFQTQDPATQRPVDGNANGGHDYDNAGLTTTQRNALVEYMKTL